MPHRRSPRPSGLVATVLLTACAAAAGFVTAAGSAHAADAVDLGKGSDYLVGRLVPATGSVGRYDEGFGQADLGLTIDTGLALAATGRDPQALADVVAFVERGHDAAGTDLGSWTGITDWQDHTYPDDYRSGGSIAKAVVLEQVVGHDPTRVGGLDLLGNLAQTLCSAPDTNGCAAAGNYRYATSTFSQALGVIAQTRAGVDAGAPTAYLAGLQAPDGSFPSLLPASGDADVDSTAVAAMALDLVPGHAAAVDRAVAWVAARQSADGGFDGTSGTSLNTAGLAVQGLALRATTYAAPLARVRAFLAAHQNADGGFGITTTETASDVRASAQAVGGSTGLSFGTLTVAGGLPTGGTGTPPTSTPTSTPPTSTAPTTTTPPTSTPPTSTPPTSTAPTSRPSTSTPAASTPAGTRETTPPGTSGSSSASAGAGSGGGSLSTSGTGPDGSAARSGGVVDSGPGSSSTASSATTPASTSTTSPASTSTPTSTSTTSTAVAGGGTTPPVRDLATSSTSGPLSKVNPLWWAVLALAVAFGVALAMTLRRRPPGAHEAGARR